MDEFEMYSSGMSIPEVSEKTGISRSTLRFRFNKAGILRSRAEGVRSAANKGKLGSGLRGKTRDFTQEHKDSIRQAKIEHGRLKSDSVRITKSGYAEFTRGENKGRLVHIFIMEMRIGRKMYKDECVHHIDGNKLNNLESNLALLTISGHARLHRREDALSGNIRERNKNGTWN